MKPVDFIILGVILVLIILIVHRHVKHLKAHPGGCAGCSAQNCPHRKKPQTKNLD